MPDVFLSYAREDEAQARQLKELLEQKEYSASWDGDLLPGADYPQQIEQAVRAARRVIVLWTPDSVRSHWVLEEATLARDEGKLVPVRLREVELPLGFRLSQTVDLRGWRGEANHPGIARLETGLGLRRRVVPPPRKDWIAWLGLAAPALLAALIVVVMARWPHATTLEADVVAKRIRFHTIAAESQTLFHDMAVRSVAIRGFAEVQLPAQSETRVAGRDSALAVDGRLVLRPSGTDPARISIRPADPREPMSIDGVSGRGAEVTIDVPEPGAVGLTVRGAKAEAGASLPPEVQIIATGCAGNSSTWPADEPSVRLRTRIGPSDRLLNFSSGDGPFRLVLGLAPDHGGSVLKTDLAVDRVEFQGQSETGDIESTIMSGTIRFPDLGRSERLETNYFLLVEDLRLFRVSQVSLSKKGAIDVRLSGTLGSVSYGPMTGLKHERFVVLHALTARPIRFLVPAFVLWILLQWLAWRRFGNAIRL